MANKCNCAKHLLNIGQITDDTSCPQYKCPKCGKLVHIDPWKYKLKDGISFTKALKVWINDLLSKQLLDVLAPKKVPDIEMEYNEYMYPKAVSQIAKYENLSLVFLAEAEFKTLDEICKEHGKKYNQMRIMANAEAAECFDILKVYENFVLKLIGWEDETEVVKNGSYNTSELSLSTATI